MHNAFTLIDVAIAFISGMLATIVVEAFFGQYRNRPKPSNRYPLSQRDPMDY